MELKIGDRVSVIDEDLEGVVTKFDDQQVSFQCTDGFEYTYALTQVIHLKQDGTIDFQSGSEIHFKEEDRKEEGKSVFHIDLKGAKPEIDLHIEVIAGNKRFNKQYNALQFQLDYTREAIAKASKARVRQLVFIHGRGGGILREALRNLIDREFPNIEYFDGNYQKYGGGATEIIIYGLDSNSN